MSAVGSSSVIEFLLSALSTSTGERYKEASSNFKLEMERRGLAWDTMEEEEQDWTLPLGCLPCVGIAEGRAGSPA